MNRGMDAAASLSHEALLAHEGFVLALARTLVRDEATARDLAQETLLTGLQRPPRGDEPLSVRSWLSRVVHRRAANERRGAARRNERERGAARHETIEPGPSAQERLELVNRVVAAVLALEEPYKGVIVAVYYESKTPQDLARQRGVPPGTVRSQLSRALELLRARLDREHGERRAWSVALLGLLRANPFLPPLVEAGAGSFVPLGLAGAAVAVIGVVAWQALDEEPDASAGVVAEHELASVPEPELVIVEPAQTRSSVEPAAPPVTEAALPTSLDELPAMLERMRQIKTVLIERRLEVPADVRARYAWLDGQPGTGVVNLIDRSLFGFDVDLPWMYGGGAYYSFTEGVHDYQRRPQVAMQKRELQSGFYGNYEGAVLDLGPGYFRDLRPGDPPFAVGSDVAAAWEHLHKPVEDYRASMQWLATGMRELGFDDDADIELGHTYLLRAISQDEFDVLVAIEVAEASPEQCTIAYRVLQERPAPNTRPPWEPPEARVAPPSAMLATPEPDLLGELDRLRARGTELLLHTMPPEASGREERCVRLVTRGSPWSEFPKEREGGAYFSFATESHSYDDEPDIELAMGHLTSGFAGQNTGVVVDLGLMPLGDVVRGWRSPGWGEAFDLAAQFELPPESDKLGQALAELRSRANALGAARPEAVVGHSYLLRSIVVGHHDHLVVVEVVAVDRYGVIIDWQILKTWPVPKR